jgi:hydrogenase maturation protease
LVHELQPELAETISRYDTVIFLDAAMEGTSVRSIAVEPATDSRPDGSHAHTPGTLLALSRDLYETIPGRSLLVAIPGQTFEFSEKLSPFAEEMVEHALEEVGHILKS